jgi:hypothetical protein
MWVWVPMTTTSSVKVFRHLSGSLDIAKKSTENEDEHQ